MARTAVRLASGLAFGAVLLASVPAVYAQDTEKAAKPVTCIMANAIDRKSAVDNKTIVFFLKGDRYYRNDMPAACASLSKGETDLVYHYNTQSAKLTRLCNYDSITVENVPGVGCPLGRFTPISGEEASQLTGLPVAASKATEESATAGDKKSRRERDK
jgi:hypothetical protein